MQVVEIKDTTREVARMMARDYRRAVQKRISSEHRSQHKALAKAFGAVARGRTVIDVCASIEQAGANAKGEPAFAYTRADARWCYYRRAATHSHPSFSSIQWGSGRARGDLLMAVESKLPVVHRTLQAMVPAIPPNLRPAGDLGLYRIMWEADWHAVPVDPLLLRPLGHGLAVVVAAWNLTELERAVLRTDEVVR